VAAGSAVVEVEIEVTLAHLCNLDCRGSWRVTVRHPSTLGYASAFLSPTQRHALVALAAAAEVGAACDGASYTTASEAAEVVARAHCMQDSMAAGFGGGGGENGGGEGGGGRGGGSGGGRARGGLFGLGDGPDLFVRAVVAGREVGRTATRYGTSTAVLGERLLLAVPHLRSLVALHLIDAATDSVVQILHSLSCRLVSAEALIYLVTTLEILTFFLLLLFLLFIMALNLGLGGAAGCAGASRAQTSSARVRCLVRGLGSRAQLIRGPSPRALHWRLEQLKQLKQLKQLEQFKRPIRGTRCSIDQQQ